MTIAIERTGMGFGSATSNARPLRFLMAGSVDDGKSTLTGRLLFDAQAILSDQLHKLQKGQVIDFAMLTDGLEAEREQGITIDVAHRYFSTRARKFIIADAPGHEQYTRNMVTAAAGSDAAVILVDITKIDFSAPRITLLPQTRRHTLLASMLRVPSIIFAVNKIDAVEQPEECFRRVRLALLEFAASGAIDVTAVLPISALRGDNVTVRGGTPWYDGPSLLDILESLSIHDTDAETDAGSFLMPVQYVSRRPHFSPGSSSRVFWGRIARSSIRIGDTVQMFPSNEQAVVTELHVASNSVQEAAFGWSVGVVVDRELDVTRGNWISSSHVISSSRRFCASLAWLDTESAQVGRKYLIRHGSRYVQGRIIAIESSLDIHTLERAPARALGVNDIGTVVIETQDPLPLQPFRENRAAGSMIMIDPVTNHTSGVLLVDRLQWDFGPLDGRTSSRVPSNIAMQIDTGLSVVLGTAKNMSSGGALIATDDVMVSGSSITLQFVLPLETPEENLTLSARIIAHQPNAHGGYNYHVAFFNIGEHEHARLQRYLSRAGGV